jgi:LmbE family N-acetylglucosaminyl deacetylase
MRILHVHAHFDDFEFVAAGTFEMWRRKAASRGEQFRARVVVCTDGKAGHQFRTRQATFEMRLKEQQESAKIGGYEFELLKLPNGQVPREACLQLGVEFQAALWKAIRDFQPDYLFCPPVAGDPLAGVHNDHVTVGDAVRRVAYMINVPHAYTPEYPTDESRSESIKVPVILNCYDPYMPGSLGYDLAVDVEDAFERVTRMTWCHQSQISEWLPWVGRHDMRAPESMNDWSAQLRRRFERQNRFLALPPERATEVFAVTAWGAVPTYEQLAADFPNLVTDDAHQQRLRDRLARWKQA